MTDLENAKQKLASGGFTVVICKGDKVYTSRKRGVAPILSLIDGGEELRGFSAADKVIGKAAAMLLVVVGVTEIYGAVMSRKAVEFLQSAGTDFFYGELCDRIKNRSGDGFCPMEQAVEHLTDPITAIAAIKQRLEEMRKENEV